MLRSSLAAAASSAERLVHGGAVAPGAPGSQAFDLAALDRGIDGQDGARAGGQRRGLGFGIGVDADHDLLARLDGRQALEVRLDQSLLHVGRLDGGHGTAHVGDARHLGRGFRLQLLDLARDLGAAVEDVAVLQQVGLEGHDLLQAQRPLLVPRARQAERLVPGRQLHGAGAGVLAHHHGQHLEQDAVDVVLRLLLGEAQRIHLHAVAEQPLLAVGDAVAVEREVLPQLGERPHLAHLGDEADAGIDEEGDAAHHLREIRLGHLAARAHRVEHRNGVGQREGQLLHRRRARLLQVIAADVHRVPLGNLAVGEADRVGRQPERGLGREDVGSAREIFLDDVVLGRALQLGALDTLGFGRGDI